MPYSVPIKIPYFILKLFFFLFTDTKNNNVTSNMGKFGINF